ncbi:LysR family transcriptional regulator [Candidimonas sp. SYP-B2681]|uniref:LysR family transcriptional regulator n=1 Tax=Candidimonas sp. SYP-B2681 TaxID=2497686 RepID=UPI000F89C3D9|nr:LysR family transcriptional regulator [Candidimonas sp. SYP-B2681]RTZ41706.1 LysR family transcriptional regulator [Candidimonas sp. SYP-B2681]
MDEFKHIRTFIKVVEAGSFSAAARDVSSVSSVARQVKGLEEQLGVRLLNRNTRNLSLTDAGRRFYERVVMIARDLDNATAEVTSLQDDVKGLLRVSLRVAVGTTIVVPALPKFLAQYPELHLEVLLTDERRDLIANKINVAMWLGHIPDVDIVARRLSPSRRIVCASPAYLEKHGVPTAPADLRHHSCLLFTAPSYRGQWSFTREGVVEEVQVSGSISSDNGLVLRSAGLAGLGLNVFHEWMVRDLLADGRMVRVLSDYTVNPRPGEAELSAVYASSRGLSRSVRLFVDFLVETFAAGSEVQRP